MMCTWVFLLESLWLLQTFPEWTESSLGVFHNSMTCTLREGTYPFRVCHNGSGLCFFDPGYAIFIRTKSVLHWNILKCIFVWYLKESRWQVMGILSATPGSNSLLQYSVFPRKSLIKLSDQSVAQNCTNMSCQALTLKESFQPKRVLNAQIS